MLHQRLKLVKNNVGLFSRLFIASHTRDGGVDTFFAHETQTTPLSLSETSQ